MSESALYDRIGLGYDAMRKADAHLVQDLRARLRLAPNTSVLDIACGTANYTAALAADARFTALDISARMLAQARSKSNRLLLVQGDAARLPFRDMSFDRLMTTLAIHHFPERRAAFAEARRVLRTGPYVVFTYFFEQMQTYWLRHYFPRNFDQPKIRLQMRAAIEADFRNAGFARLDIEPWFVPRAFSDGFFYADKYRPERYLDPAIRPGISCFADPYDAVEIERGLAQLAVDVESGAVHEIVAADNDPLGDYVFIIAWP